MSNQDVYNIHGASKGGASKAPKNALAASRLAMKTLRVEVGQLRRAGTGQVFRVDGPSDLHGRQSMCDLTVVDGGDGSLVDAKARRYVSTVARWPVVTETWEAAA